jgi:hypothetical protein
MQKWKNYKGVILDPEDSSRSEKLRSCSSPLLDYYSMAKAKLEKLRELGND